jgi:elongation factor G
MRVEVTVPSEFQGAIVGAVNRRKGLIQSSDAHGDDVVINAEVPLNNMFGYSTELRSMTQGKGEFAMEYMRHSAVTQDVQAELMKAHGKVGRRGM